MTRLTTPQLDESRLTDGPSYLVAGLSAATGTVLATHRLLLDVQLLGALLPLAVALVIAGPLIMGYTGHTYLAGVLTGVMPSAGAYVSVLTWPPFDARRIETMLTSALIGTGLALPLVAVLFIVGVGLRRDGSLADQKRDLIVRLFAALLVSGLILAAHDMGILQTYGDQ